MTHDAPETVPQQVLRNLSALSHLTYRLMETTRADDATLETVQQMHRLTTESCQLLRTSGQELPPPPPSVMPVPLHLLDTVTNRRYLDALNHAHQCALAVDYERGYGDDGLAQDLEDMCVAVRLEIFGPAGATE